MRVRKWVFRNDNSVVEVEDGTLSVGIGAAVRKRELQNGSSFRIISA